MARSETEPFSVLLSPLSAKKLPLQRQVTMFLAIQPRKRPRRPSSDEDVHGISKAGKEEDTIAELPKQQLLPALINQQEQVAQNMVQSQMLFQVKLFKELFSKDDEDES
eukprot:scpid86908/ scgid28352/ 